MCGVVWCSFSWEAFATIFTGLAAVGGAYLIARLQLRNMDHQTTVERLKLRRDTFELRWEVYRATADWLRAWFQEGDRPTGEVDSNFLWAIEKSKFLFRPEVARQLNAWHTDAVTIHALGRRMERVDDAEVERLQARVVEAAARLEAAFSGIVPLFGEEMAISELNTTLPPLPKPPRPADGGI